MAVRRLISLRYPCDRRYRLAETAFGRLLGSRRTLDLRRTPAADTSIPLSPSGTSISSESSLASLQIDLPPSRGPSRELLVTIKGMMRSDPIDRWTLQDVWDFPVVQRLLGMHSAERSTRVSLESVARSSLDEWEDWHRQRGQLSLNPSPSSARISIPILQLHRQASPALVPESPDFLDDILRCWQRLYI
jgi:hypothetical protein